MSKNSKLIDKISLDLVELLLHLRGADNLQQVAKKTNMTQPSMSRKLQRLTQELKIPLFVESGRRKVLSATALELCFELESPVFQIRHCIRRFQQRLSSAENCTFQIGGRLEVLTQFLLKAPPKPIINAIPCESDEVIKRLLEQKIDLGLTHSPSSRSEIIAKKLGHQKVLLGISPVLMASAPTKDKTKKGAKSWLEVVRREPYLIYKAGVPFMDEFIKNVGLIEGGQASSKSLGNQSGPSHSIAYWPTLLDLARKHRGWILFPDNFRDFAHDLELFDVSEYCSFEMDYFLLARKELFEISWFREWFRAI